MSSGPSGTTPLRERHSKHRRRRSGAFSPVSPRQRIEPDDQQAAQTPPTFATRIAEDVPSSSSTGEGNDTNNDNSVRPTNLDSATIQEGVEAENDNENDVDIASNGHSTDYDNQDEDEDDNDSFSLTSSQSLTTMEPLVKILAAALKELKQPESNSSVLAKHRITNDLTKELQNSSYGKNQYDGNNNILAFANFSDFVQHKFKKYSPLIDEAKFAAKDFFTELIAETMKGRVPDTLVQMSHNQPDKYSTITESSSHFLKQVARLSILPAEANSVYDKALETPSKLPALKLYNQLKRLQTVSRVMNEVHGSPTLDDHVLLFILRNKMHPLVKTKVEAEMVEKQYSLSTEGIETFYVHKATQYEAILLNKHHKLNLIHDNEEPEDEPTSEPVSTETNDVDIASEYLDELEESLCTMQEHAAKEGNDTELQSQLQEQLHKLAVMRKQEGRGRKPNGKRPNKQGQRYPDNTLKVMQGNQPSTQACPLNWKPPSVADRRLRYEQGLCTTCGSKNHFRAQCPCASRMQSYISKQPPIQQRLHCILDTLNPDVEQMDDQEQEFHCNLLEHLDQLEQAFH